MSHCSAWARARRKTKNRRATFLVAAALTKTDAGVALLVREVGAAVAGKAGMCVCCLCFARAFTFSKSDASAQEIMCGVCLS